jgi:flagellar biosynthesis/type III secretory pathway M-ring protein FliF/YscJ
VLALAVALVAFLLLRKRRAAPPAVQHSAELAANTELAQTQAAALAAPSQHIPPITSKTQLLLNELQESVAKDPVFAANIVRSWLED